MDTVLFIGFMALVFASPLIWRLFLRSRAKKSKVAAFLLEQDEKARARNKMILGTVAKIALNAAAKK